jgi:hypothetical protein
MRQTDPPKSCASSRFSVLFLALPLMIFLIAPAAKGNEIGIGPQVANDSSSWTHADMAIVATEVMAATDARSSVLLAGEILIQKVHPGMFFGKTQARMEALGPPSFTQNEYAIGVTFEKFAFDWCGKPAATLALTIWREGQVKDAPAGRIIKFNEAMIIGGSPQEVALIVLSKATALMKMTPQFQVALVMEMRSPLPPSQEVSPRLIKPLIFEV